MIPHVGTPLSELLGPKITVSGPGFSTAALRATGEYEVSQEAPSAAPAPVPKSDLSDLVISNKPNTLGMG